MVYPVSNFSDGNYTKPLNLELVHEPTKVQVLILAFVQSLEYNP